MIDPNDLRHCVIRPVLRHLGMYSLAAENLLLGTAITESVISGDMHLRQKGGGPALSIYQIEPATHDDIWSNWLKWRPVTMTRVLRYSAGAVPRAEQLAWNLGYATAMARLVYRRKPQALPHEDDIGALARYWKIHYNTSLGAGTPEYFINKAAPYLRA